jgi:hypothetical protein
MTDTMLFGILKMPFEMAMKDEISRLQYYARVQELVGRFEAQQQAEPVADGDKVICPACCHQFRGIPETVQTLMLHAGFEPPFTTPPKQQAEPDRRPLQAEGKHPAPCARHCEAKAFEIEIRSLKSALETQAASKEDMKVYRSIVDNYWKGLAAKAEQQAEPVAWTTMPEAEDWCFVSGSKDPTGKLEGKWFPLYTTPPQRPWVGLTVTTILNMMPSAIPAEYDGPLMEFARAIEAKLKERNT